MSTLNKVLIIVGAIVVAVLFGIIIYQQHEMTVQQNTIQTQIAQQQQLMDGITKSSSQYATKADLDNFITQNGLNLKVIQDSVSGLNATITAANSVQTNSKPQQTNNAPSTSTGPNNPTPPTDDSNDPYGYMKAQQNLALNEQFQTSSGVTNIPSGSAGFSAWQKDPWSLNIPTRQYNLTTVVATDPNQQTTFYNKFSITVDGKEYDAPITTAKTVQQVPTATFSWWNPRLLMGLDGGVNITHVKGEFTPSINMGIMSYGQYKTTPDLSILEVGVGYGAINKTGQFILTPIAYNIGKNLFSPLMNNTYVGPNFTVATDGSLGAGLGLRVGF